MDACKKLLDWAETNGARVCFTINGRTRKVHATKQIDVGQEICFIPGHLLFSSSVVQMSPVIQHFNQSLNEAPDKKIDISGYPFAIDIVSMALFIVYEKYNQPLSFWRPYLDSLPQKYNLPICWEESKILYLLRNTPLEFKTIERRRWAQKVVDVVSQSCHKFFSDDTWNLENFIWAFCTILSRAFPKATTTSEIENWITLSEICLYPVLDMLDHKRNQKIHWDMRKDGVAFLAGEELIEGTEVLNNYSLKGNENLLENYGFVLEHNPEDYYKVYLNVYDCDPLISEKRICLSKMEKNSLEHLIFDDGKLPKDLLSVTRVLCSNSSEILKLNERNDYSGDPIVGLRNEFVSLKTLFDLLAAKKSLISFGETDTSTDEDSIHALIYRRGLENVLNSSMNTLIRMATELLGEGIHSIFFTIHNPDIDPIFLRFVCDERLGFDDDTILSLCALKTYKGIPQKSIDSFG